MECTCASNGSRGGHLREGPSCAEAKKDEFQVGHRDPSVRDGRSLWKVCGDGTCFSNVRDVEL